MPSETPISNPSFEEDYKALSHGSWFNIYGVAYIEVTGADRVLFLHRILTQDLKNLKPGQSALAAMLHANGKTLFLCEVLMLEEKILLLLEKDIADKALSLLDRFVIADDVTLQKVSRNFDFILSTEKAALLPGSGISFQSHLFLPNSTGFLFPKDSAKTTQEHLPGLKNISLESAAYEFFRIEKGVKRYGKDLGEDIILSEAGLDHEAWVSETKGCYPGQEVIAKIKTYKGLRRKIHLFQWKNSEAPALNSPVFSVKSKQAVGNIKSAVTGEVFQKGLGWCYLPEPWPREEGLIFKAGVEEIALEILDF